LKTTKQHSTRIQGIDFARALAVIGMIIVNFKIVMGGQGVNAGVDWIQRLYAFANFFSGKASATFVVLAGMGLAFMTNSARLNNDGLKLNKLRNGIAKRAAFLFVVGLSYMIIWPADILHYYGVYMVFCLFFVTANSRIIWLLLSAIILLYPVIVVFLPYESNWNFITLEYSGFWTFSGFIKNLFVNGFHPVLPWVSFMLFGLWLGRQNLQNGAFLKKGLLVSSSVFIAIQVVSRFMVNASISVSQISQPDAIALFGVEPMPPFPLYMINGISFSVLVIFASIKICNAFSNSLVQAFVKTGKLALTFYVAHVVIGMVLPELITPYKLGDFTLVQTVSYALIFSLSCVVFAVVWLKYFKQGPLEWVMRKIVD
jgi:uncharacterized membrane protein YeiB